MTRDTRKALTWIGGLLVASILGWALLILAGFAAYRLYVMASDTFGGFLVSAILVTFFGALAVGTYLDRRDS